MSAKDDASLGLRAKIYATRDDVVAACARAGEVLGRRAEVTKSATKVTVKIFPGMVRAVSSVSPLVGIGLKPADDGAVIVDARIERYRTSQSMIAGFIPVGRKLLVGRGIYKNLLAALEAELDAIDSGNGIIERTGATR